MSEYRITPPINTGPLTEQERALIHAAETRPWRAPLREALRLAVEKRGIITSPFDDPGMLADILAGSPR